MRGGSLCRPVTGSEGVREPSLPLSKMGVPDPPLLSFPCGGPAPGHLHRVVQEYHTEKEHLVDGINALQRNFEGLSTILVRGGERRLGGGIDALWVGSRMFIEAPHPMVWVAGRVQLLGWTFPHPPHHGPEPGQLRPPLMDPHRSLFGEGIFYG